MAKDSILQKDHHNYPIQAFELPESGNTTVVTVTTSSAATSALDAAMYRFLSDVTCYIAKGATATTSDLGLSAGVPEYFHVVQGETVASITASGTATLRITKC